MRGIVDGLPSPHPLGSTLPPIYLDDNLTQRITAGLDEVLAPVLNVLDNLDAYLDPALAPSDFYEWLAGWVAVVLDERWSPDRQRALIAQAAKLYGVRVPHLKVRVRAADPGSVDLRRLETVVAASRPADVPHDIEVVAR